MVVVLFSSCGILSGDDDVLGASSPPADVEALVSAAPPAGPVKFVDFLSPNLFLGKIYVSMEAKGTSIMT